MFQNLNFLTGYDSRGIVYDANNFILRKISPDYLSQTMQIYELYKNFNLKKMGFVETELESYNGEDFFKHKKHLITYPFEWSTNMLKDAALFHLDLFIELDKYNLTLKDAIPNNILFDYSDPVFVDFLSIIKKENLIKESWLLEGVNKQQKDLRFTIFDKMFIPFIFVPIVLMGFKKYAKARDLLLYKTCNNKDGKSPEWQDLINRDSKKNYLKSLIDIFKLRVFYNLNKREGFINFVKQLYFKIQNINVTPARSSYDSYYENKKENFDFEQIGSWKNKQLNVFNIIKIERPKTVLDLGANTGWYSILAAKNSAKVVATDIDESCIDLLYRYAKMENLKIAPLFLPFENLTLELYGMESNNNSSKSPLFIAATKRLKSELVLCLALVHHLILGMGKTVSEVIKILSDLTEKILVLEYIALDDEMIKSEPTFFKNLDKSSDANYNINLFIEEGKKYFKDFEILDSHPGSRKLLIFKK